MNQQDEIGRALAPAKMVAAAIVASLVIYLALVEILKTTLKPFRSFDLGVDLQIARYAAYGAGAAVVLLILFLRPGLFRRRAGEDTAAALLRLQKAAIVTTVLGEVPVILGLVLFLVRGGAGDFYRLLFVSIVLVFIHFPRRGAWEESLKG